MTPTANKRPPALYTHLQLYEKLPAVNGFSSSTVRSNFFSQRVVNVWNSLPTSVDFSKLTLSAFKRSLQRVNLNEFLTVYKFSVVCDCV